MYYYGKQIRLRAPERGDIPLFAKWLSNPEMRYYITMRYISQALEERWFDGMLGGVSGGAPEKLHFVIETLEGERSIGVLGMEGINWRDRETEVGLFIGEPDCWNKGYGGDALCTALNVGFRWFNLHRIFLRVVADNVRAIRCYEKCGFQHEGRMRDSVFIDGVYKDLLVMSVLEQEYTL